MPPPGVWCPGAVCKPLVRPVSQSASSGLQLSPTSGDTPPASSSASAAAHTVLSSPRSGPYFRDYSALIEMASDPPKRDRCRRREMQRGAWVGGGQQLTEFCYICFRDSVWNTHGVSLMNPSATPYSCCAFPGGSCWDVCPKAFSSWS